MKIIILIGNSILSKYVASEFNKKIKTLATIIEDKKNKKLLRIFNRLKKNPFLMPYKLIEIIYLNLEDKLMSKKINHYFLRYSTNLKNKMIVNSINDDKTKKIIRSLKPDLGVVIGTSIIKEDIINLFSKGLINLHTGVLPKYRGLRSEFWALYNKDYNNIGVTIHKISNRIDSGEILLQKKLKYNGENEFKLKCKNIELGKNLLIKTVMNFNKIKPKKQENGYYYSNPRLLDVIKFKMNN